MAAYVLVSAKGAPGVTTAAAAVAAAAIPVTTSLLVELDPAGGSALMLGRGSAAAGLVEAAGQLRREPSRAAVVENVTLLPPGVPTLVAPTAGGPAESVIDSVGSRWMTSLRMCADTVVVDGGRWEVSQRTAARVRGADLVAVVCRPTLEGVEHTRHIVDAVREAAQQRVAVIVVGRRPYAPEEVAGHLDVPLAGSLAWDPRAVTRLWGSGASRLWLRSRLARSAAEVLQGLAGAVVAPPSLPAAPASPAAPDPSGAPGATGAPSGWPSSAGRVARPGPPAPGPSAPGPPPPGPGPRSDGAASPDRPAPPGRPADATPPPTSEPPGQPPPGPPSASLDLRGVGR